MVNLGKRLRRLEPLWRVRNGIGAAVLPPAPAPRLVRFRVQCFEKNYKESRFWREVMTRLKYYNPALPMALEKAKDAQGIVSVQFESEDKKSLEAILKRASVFESFAKEKAEQVKKKSELEVAESISGKKEQFNAPLQLQPLNEMLKPENPERLSPDNGKILLKPQTPADPSASPSLNPPKATYTLTISRPLGLYSWQWFKIYTDCKPVITSEQEWAEGRRIQEVQKLSDVDRQRVKKGTDAIKKEKEDLKLARGAAEKMQAEAV